MIKNKQKGFTLIELLVVIAIIGILSGTVIVSMSGAQDSAKNSRIKAGMDQMRSWAEVYRLLHQDTGYGDENTNFTTVVGSDGYLIKDDINSQAPTGAFLALGVTKTAYCMSIQLNASSTTHYCMDSTGKVVQSETAICAATTCPN